MPSIRETLQEIGVTPEEVYAQLIQKSGDSLSNGTAPTPLTNYLDVRNFGTLTDSQHYEESSARPAVYVVFLI